MDEPAQQHGRGTWPRAEIAFVAAALVLFALARITLMTQGVPKVFNDTATYDGTYTGARIECDFSFWTGIRPFVIPLVHTAFQRNHDGIALFQSILGALSWAMLAVTVAASLRRPALRGLALMALLALGLSRPMTVWDQAMLSESVAYSLQILLVASAFWLCRRWTLPRAAMVLFLAFLWAFVRDSHLYYLLLVALSLAPFALWHAYRRRLIALCAALLLIVFVGNHLASVSLRWVGNFYNVLTVRALTNPDHLAYLETRGLPVTGDLTELAGKLHTAAMHHAPEFALLREWTHAQGKSVYTRLLLTHPHYLLHAPLQELDTLLGYQKVHQKRFAPDEIPGLLPVALEEFLYPQRFGLAVVLLALVWAGAAGMAIARGELPRAAWLPVGLVLLSFPHAVLTWHGDAMETGRHALMPAFQLRLGLLLGLLMTADALRLHGIRRPRPRES